jgi:LmbE family N-acetylglucosaminyl deacetylase
MAFAAVGAVPTRNDLLSQIASGSVYARTLVVAAHPDDEVIGAGALLSRAADATIAHVTDGAPVDPRLPDGVRDPERLRYAAAREIELASALMTLGLPPARRIALGLVDQQADAQLGLLVRVLEGLLELLRPDLVLTHAYEGGHPDHDAAALATSVALKRRARAGNGPLLVEMPYYHQEGGALVMGDFLPPALPDTIERRLSDADRRLKEELFRCFPSQWEILATFPTGIERFRPAPDYDFEAAPHAGALHYERMRWADGATFRRRASELLRDGDGAVRPRPALP